MNQFIQVAIILQERAGKKEHNLRDTAISVMVQSETFELNLGFSIESEPEHEPKSCIPCEFEILSMSSDGNYSISSAICYRIQPKVSLTKSVIGANDCEPFIINQIFVDGDPIRIEANEFDIHFYQHYIERFIHSESELIDFLNLFEASFRLNSWYQKSDGAWLHRLITNSKWNSAYLKGLFGCLKFEDGLIFLESEELKRYGYVPLLRAFKINYANTSKSIVNDADVASKLEEWMPRTEFNDHVNKLFHKQIENYKTRKKTYFDPDLKDWKLYDGSLESKKKIFLSQFSSYPEFEAKRRIIQKLIRKAENEVRLKKGFTVLGTLINESILYSRLKEHFCHYTIVSQYRPKWLGRQSLDIYIEELKVGIEYQGDQHMRPIEFFGGAEAFEKTKLRDQKKSYQCNRNGCRLIYVYPGYKFEEVVQKIIQIEQT